MVRNQRKQATKQQASKDFQRSSKPYTALRAPQEYQPNFSAGTLELALANQDCDALRLNQPMSEITVGLGSKASSAVMHTPLAWSEDHSLNSIGELSSSD